MKRLFTVLFVLLLLQRTGYSTAYYVSNAGKDADNGTSPAASWQTLARVSLIFKCIKILTIKSFLNVGTFTIALLILIKKYLISKIVVG